MATKEPYSPDHRPQRKQEFLLLTEFEPKLVFETHELLAGAIIANPAGFGIDGLVLRVEDYFGSVSAVYVPEDCEREECECSWAVYDFKRHSIAESLAGGAPSVTWVGGQIYTEPLPELAVEDVERNPEHCEQSAEFETEWVEVYLPTR
jgi:hypothetical protein